MKTLLRCALLAILSSGSASLAHAGDLKLTMQGGRVTIIAQDVPLQQILHEWARIGNTKIVNGERVPGVPMTLELINVPERQALDTLLRSAAGYMAAPRPAGVMGASLYDRIMILPISHPPAVTASVAAPPPFQARPQPQPMPVDDDDEPVNMPTPMPNPAMQNPVVANPAMPNATVSPFPGAPPQPGQVQTPPVLTSPRPGALPLPQQPANGVPNPYQPPVVRPVGPGGPGGEGDDR